jgi:NADH-quinone oxidoreductase subunit L
MTAFYMFRLMALTFFGAYRGAAWAAHASPAARLEAAVHGAAHPRDPHAHGQANRPDHEVSHGAADVVTSGHVWHGPHESPRIMTWPLVALAAGAVVAGFAGVPQALGGTNAIEHFLEPAFGPQLATAAVGNGASHAVETLHLSRTAEIGLMLVSVVIAAAGILVARYFYLTNPAVPASLADRWRGVYSLLLNKYYVDEVYDATVVRATTSSARGLWIFDNRVVDGIVNGWGWLTQIAAWVSHMLDKYVVDGLVNFVGWTAGEGSFSVRRLQTGLVQNYALMMLVGLFVFLTVYLLAR